MNTKNLIERIRELFLYNRRGGTTTLLKEAVKDKKVWVLVPTEDEAKEFGDSAISLTSLFDGKTEGVDARPVLMDNNAMLKLCELVGINITTLEEEKKDRDLRLKNIYEELIRFYNRTEYPETQFSHPHKRTPSWEEIAKRHT